MAEMIFFVGCFREMFTTQIHVEFTEFSFLIAIKETVKEGKDVTRSQALVPVLLESTGQT